jgi:ubiquinone/menaquinone biosynthesis C-methylase UbiE
VTVDKDLRATFDTIAELYDEARPGYPEQLIDDAIALSGIPPGGRILEVGCGPGKATLPFARRGYAMVCVELGENLATLATEHCQPYPDVEIQNMAFEEWPLQEKAFDLVLSAQAFHWIPPKIGYPKAAAALKDNGAIALIWNHSPVADTPFRRAIRKVYEKRAPQLVEHLPDNKTQDDLDREIVDIIDASSLFGEVTVKHYPWSETCTAERHIKNISTYSPIRALAPEERHDLLEDIREVIEQFGGTVESHNAAVLYLARVKR